MNGIFTHARMELKLFFRETVTVFFALLLPAVAFLFLGMMFGGQSAEMLMPSLIGFVLFTTGLFTIGLQVIIDREKGVYKRLCGTPLSPVAIFTAILVKGFVAVFIGTLEMILLALFVFEVQMTDHLPSFLLAVTLSALTFFGIGFLLAALVKRMQTAMGIGMLSLFLMFFLTGSTFPTERMPQGIRLISEYTPIKYAVELMQAGWTGSMWSTASSGAVLVLGGTLVVCAVIGVKYFRWEA